MTVDSQNQAARGSKPRRRPPSTRRAERMADTRRRLIETSLELFAREGFDRITTEEIAARAGVSSSTLFRYFPTKESLLFASEYDYTSILCETIVRQPADYSDIQALIASMVELAPMMASVRDRIRLYNQVAASSPLLLGRERAQHLDNVALIAEAIAARRGRRFDAETTLLADVASTVLGRAHDQWLAGPPRRNLADVIRAHFATITAALSDVGGRD
jgi:AcrR family transcriptional regulator